PPCATRAAQRHNGVCDSAGAAAPAYGLRHHAMGVLSAGRDGRRGVNRDGRAIAAIAALTAAAGQAACEILARPAAAANGLRKHTYRKGTGRRHSAVCIGRNLSLTAILPLARLLDGGTPIATDTLC